MKANASPLSILDFAITKMDFNILPPPKGNEADIDMGNYEIDIDFGIQIKDFIQVYISAKINTEEQLPGYRLFAEAGCFFKFNDGVKLSDQQKAEIEGYSTVYIALNSLRGLISSFTANAPFGRYILPSIDLNDLIAKKRDSLIADKKSNKTVASKNKKVTVKESSRKAKTN